MHYRRVSGARKANSLWKCWFRLLLLIGPVEGFICDQCPLALKDKGSQPGKITVLDNMAYSTVSSASAGFQHLNQTDKDVCKFSRSCPTSRRVAEQVKAGMKKRKKTLDSR